MRDKNLIDTIIEKIYRLKNKQRDPEIIIYVGIKEIEALMKTNLACVQTDPYCTNPQNKFMDCPILVVHSDSHLDVTIKN